MLVNQAMQSYQTEEFYLLKFTLFNQQHSSSHQKPAQFNIQMLQCKNNLVNMEKVKESKYELFEEDKENTAPLYLISLPKGQSWKENQEMVTFRCSFYESFLQPTITDFHTTIPNLLTTTQKHKYTTKTLFSNDYSQKLQIMILKTQYKQSLENTQSKITVDLQAKLQDLTTEESFMSSQNHDKFQRSPKKNIHKMDKRTKRAQIYNFQLLKESRISQKKLQDPNQSHSIRFLMKASKLRPVQYHNDAYESDDSNTWQDIKKQATSKFYIFTLFVEVVIMFMLMSPSTKL